MLGVLMLIYKGAKEIGRAIGAGRNEVPRLVDQEGLPAWKESDAGPWKALPEDLRAWLVQRRKKYLGEVN